MNNIFGNFGCGCNNGFNNDNCCGIDSCWLIMLMLLCGCKMDYCIDPCCLIMLLLMSNCCGGKQNNNCCN